MEDSDPPTSACSRALQQLRPCRAARIASVQRSKDVAQGVAARGSLQGSKSPSAPVRQPHTASAPPGRRCMRPSVPRASCEVRRCQVRCARQKREMHSWTRPAHDFFAPRDQTGSLKTHPQGSVHFVHKDFPRSYPPGIIYAVPISNNLVSFYNPFP